MARGDRTLEEAEYGFRNAGDYLTLDYAIDTTAASPAVIASWLAERVRARALDGDDAQGC